MIKIIVLLITLLLTGVTFAKTGQTLNLYLENDSRSFGGPGSDNAYTNGFKFSLIAADNKVPKWAKPLIEFSGTLNKALKESETNFSVSIGHQIYTPNNLAEAALIVNDRPYAAWLYLGLSANFKDEQRSHVVELDVGVVGPAAGGEGFQNSYHRIAGTDLAQGWKNQLGNEATLQLSYQQRQKFYALKNEKLQNYFDVIPVYGATLGNVAINVSGGAFVRLGTNLPNDFGPTRAATPEGDTFVEPDQKTFKDSSIYFFAGGRGIAVARNIFLDGNTFQDSPSVHKNSFIVETELGMGIHLYNWGAAWSFVTRSAEFAEKNNLNSFASISLTYSF